MLIGVGRRRTCSGEEEGGYTYSSELFVLFSGQMDIYVVLRLHMGLVVVVDTEDLIWLVLSPCPVAERPQHSGGSPVGKCHCIESLAQFWH